ncbi:DUF981 family protein [Paraliobacillus ryukyuensis]|uniref:DUF981 family protein n=1 Tax=Paraliobacillus ryukyuensis TaxID=200904 RepID=UPI002118C2C3|nr:DUF981 family protein [Paraliobacillus ryukyuensis]
MKLTIDWAATQMYNTTMAVVTGVALLLIIQFLNKIKKGQVEQLEGWSVGFGAMGFILTLTGAHMTLTWPLAEVGFPFDDIIFGEPTLVLGVILLGIAVLLWRKANTYTKAGVNDKATLAKHLQKDIASLMRPLAWIGAAMGGALISIAIAGITYKLFAAPPEEPISGAFAAYPMVEATFISGLYAITGIGAICFPFVLKTHQLFSSSLYKILIICWKIAGYVFVLFGIMNFFTHIGLIVNTM